VNRVYYVSFGFPLVVFCDRFFLDKLLLLDFKPAFFITQNNISYLTGLHFEHFVNSNHQALV